MKEFIKFLGTSVFAGFVGSLFHLVLEPFMLDEYTMGIVVGIIISFVIFIANGLGWF